MGGWFDARGSASGEDGRKRMAKIVFGIGRKLVCAPPDEIVGPHQQSPTGCESSGLRPGAVGIDCIPGRSDTVRRNGDAEVSRYRLGRLDPRGTVVTSEQSEVSANQVER
jgi:hypothetical protein